MRAHAGSHGRSGLDATAIAVSQFCEAPLWARATLSLVKQSSRPPKFCGGFRLSLKTQMQRCSSRLYRD